jgi:universal stress protein A
MSISFNTILCPVDFSELSKKAAEYAAIMAKKFKSQLILLHVVEPFLTNTYVTFDPSIGSQVAETMEKKAKELLDEMAKKLGKETVHIKIVKGNVSEEIVAEAKKSKADLIVMGTNGLSGLSHFFIGSNAEKVVRHAPCAVFTVKS